MNNTPTTQSNKLKQDS